MAISIYFIIYIILNVLSTYTIYKFHRVFFSKIRSNQSLCLISYFFYYVFITFIYLYFNLAYLTMLCNIVLFFLLTFNYDTDFKHRIMSTLTIYSILLITECISVLIFNLFPLENSMIYALFSTRILSLVIVFVLNNLNNIKNNVMVPFEQWLSIFFFPLGTLIIFILFIEKVNYITLSITLIILLVFNIFVFFLYDNLSCQYQKNIEEQLLLKTKQFEATTYYREKIFYENQLRIIKKSESDIRSLKHDIKNHQIVLLSYLEKGDLKNTLRYVKEISSITNSTSVFSDTGNTVIDSILNHKLNYAYENGMEINLQLKIPNILHINSTDLCIILGNLLDNSIEAVDKIKINKKINIKIEYEKGILFIFISNPCLISTIQDTHTTTKTDQDNHGFGLINVNKSLANNKGMINSYIKDSIYYVEVMLYEI